MACTGLSSLNQRKGSQSPVVPQSLSHGNLTWHCADQKRCKCRGKLNSSIRQRKTGPSHGNCWAVCILFPSLEFKGTTQFSELLMGDSFHNLLGVSVEQLREPGSELRKLMGSGQLERTRVGRQTVDASQPLAANLSENSAHGSHSQN